MATIHASAVLVGSRAVLLRGPSGSGKSRFALELLQAATAGVLPFARLVSDDRVHLDLAHGRLVVRPPEALAGLLEIRGLGVRRLDWEPIAVLGWVVDLGAEPDRLPLPASETAEIDGVTLPRLAFRSCIGALPVLLAALSGVGRARSEEFDLRSAARSLS